MKNKQIEKILSKIKPTKEEVDSMNEWEWTTTVYPIKCFNEGISSERQRILDILDSFEDEGDFICLSKNQDAITECNRMRKKFLELKQAIQEKK